MSKTIGIFLAGQNGDILTASSVLHYRGELWGHCKIVWYMEERNFDLLKYSDVELRPFPRGFGYPEMVEEENKKGGILWEDWKPLVDEKNHLNLELKKNFTSLADIDYGYFPAPHQMTPKQRHGIEYPNISKKVFGVPDHYEWHPCLGFYAMELVMASKFFDKVGGGKKVLIETFAGSGQSRLNEQMISTTMNICSECWPGCKFIFASHKFLHGNESFPEALFDDKNIFSCADFTVRQCALIADQCDLMISVSSGITVAASAWGIRQPPTLQFCGSAVCSTRALAHTQFELVTADDKAIANAHGEYYTKLLKLLNLNK